MKRANVAVNVLNKIASTLAIPIVSTLPAQAAVVIVSAEEYSLESGTRKNVKQFLALADRGGSDWSFQCSLGIAA